MTLFEPRTWGWGGWVGGGGGRFVDVRWGQGGSHPGSIKPSKHPKPPPPSKSAHVFDGGVQLVPGEPLPLEQLLPKPRVLRQRQHQVLHAHKRVPHLGLDLHGARDAALQVAPQHLLRAAAALARLAADEGVRLVQDAGGVRPRLADDAARQAVGLLQQRLEQVLRLHDLLRVGGGDLGGGDDGLPRLFRELVLGDALAARAGGAGVVGGGGGGDGAAAGAAVVVLGLMGSRVGLGGVDGVGVEGG